MIPGTTDKHWASRSPLWVSAVWLVAAALIGLSGDFPLNDDWQYAFPVKSLVESGRLEMRGVFAPNIILQAAWGYLFCWLAGSFSFVWLRLSTLVLALAGGWFFYRLARRLGATPLFAALGMALLLFNPLYFNLAFTFMTDVPFAALVLLALLAFERHLASRRAGWLVAACSLSVAAYLIRQPGIVLLPAYGLWLAWEQKGKIRALGGALLLTGGAVAVYLVYEKAGKPWLGISGNFVPVSSLYLEQIQAAPLEYGKELVRKLVKTWIYLGFFGLPLLPFLWRAVRQSGWLRWRLALPLLAFNLGLLAFLHHIDKIFPFGGNILFNLGLGPELLADVYTLGLPNTPRLPDWLMYVINLLSQLSATALLGAGATHWRQHGQRNRRFFSFLFIFSALYLPAMSITSFFDRYLLIIIAAAFLYLLPLAERPFRWRQWLPLLLMCLFSLLATHDYLAWNRARHQAYEWLQERGVGIQQMDAGYEYNGFYNYHESRIEEEGRSYWWVTENEWMITFGPVAGYRTARRFSYRRWLWGSRVDFIHTLQRSKD